jgi:hypothetical protein
VGVRAPIAGVRVRNIPEGVVTLFGVEVFVNGVKINIGEMPLYKKQALARKFAVLEAINGASYCSIVRIEDHMGSIVVEKIKALNPADKYCGFYSQPAKEEATRVIWEYQPTKASFKCLHCEKNVVLSI